MKNFEIKPIFPIKPFFHLTKKSKQKFKYLENEKSFESEIKRPSVAKNCLRPESAPYSKTKLGNTVLSNELEIGYNLVKFD